MKLLSCLLIVTQWLTPMLTTSAFRPISRVHHSLNQYDVASSKTQLYMASSDASAKKKVLVLGGDGFCGWPTSLYLSDQGHTVIIVDNLSRRNIDIELGCDSLTPIQSPEVCFLYVLYCMIELCCDGFRNVL